MFSVLIKLSDLFVITASFSQNICSTNKVVTKIVTFDDRRKFKGEKHTHCSSKVKFYNNTILTYIVDFSKSLIQYLINGQLGLVEVTTTAYGKE